MISIHPHVLPLYSVYGGGGRVSTGRGVKREYMEEVPGKVQKGVQAGVATPGEYQQQGSTN